MTRVSRGARERATTKHREHVVRVVSTSRGKQTGQLRITRVMLPCPKALRKHMDCWTEKHRRARYWDA